jgi:hypothetical protein
MNMKARFYLTVTALFFLFVFLSPSQVLADATIVQPSVSRRVIICDQWQWIGGSAITWGCLSTPRAAEIAGGQITDQVVASLQEQINQLNAKVKKLEIPQK